MKAACIDRTGPPEVIEIRSLPDPMVGESQIAIRPTWVAVNPIDCYLRSGLVTQSLPNPYIIGCDCAGTVESVGSKVTAFKPGDRVWTTNQGLAGRQGITAERVAVDQEWVYPSPSTVSDRDLAACGLVGVTAHLGLFHHGQLQPGEIVLVKGGGGGIGSMVIQLAKAVGATVVATTSSPEKIERCRKLGADHVFDYRHPQWIDQVLKQVPGIDLCWETARDPNLAESIGLMREHGRMILMAGREAKAQLPVGPFYVKQLKLLGLIVFKNQAAAIGSAASQLNQWLETGKIQAAIAATLPWTSAADAHRLQEQNTLQKQGGLFGKIMLQVE